jgi:hypothetical protein
MKTAAARQKTRSNELGQTADQMWVTAQVWHSKAYRKTLNSRI